MGPSQWIVSRRIRDTVEAVGDGPAKSCDRFHLNTNCVCRCYDKTLSVKIWRCVALDHWSLAHPTIGNAEDWLGRQGSYVCARQKLGIPMKDLGVVS